MSVDPITCHILDTTLGRPASNVSCALYYVGSGVELNDENATDTSSPTEPFARGRTDADGRIKSWVFNPGLSMESKSKIGISNKNIWQQLKPGIYKIKFLTGRYFYNLGNNARTFFPYVEITFIIENPPDKHYHIPLLLSNHSYTTYRGS